MDVKPVKMKYISCFLAVLLVFLLLIGFNIESIALNIGFATESLPSENAKKVVKNVNISVLHEEPDKQSIECFDVNENGLIAIGCESFDDKTVAVYSNDGVFQYGYKFETSGSFGVEWDNDILVIYFVRSDIAIAVDSGGNVDSVLKISNTIENNSYWNHSVFSKTRQVGNDNYIIKNDMGFFNWFASSYSQLVKIDSNGESHVLYDVNSAQMLKMIAMFVGVLVFVCFVVIVVIRQFAKLR